MTLQLPLSVLPEPGVSITVDDGPPRTLAYRLCNNNGCMATFPLDEKMRTAFTKGQTARVEISTGDDKPLGVQISLQGFSAALNAL